MAQSLSHSEGYAIIVFTPKYKRKVIYYQLRENIQKIIKDLCKWKGIVEEHIMLGHVHLLLSTPPKNSISQIMGCLKRKKCNDDI